MKKIFILFLLAYYSCGSPSETTVCPCTVVGISSVKEGYEVTVKGKLQGSVYSSEFTFSTTSSYKIGDVIK